MTDWFYDACKRTVMTVAPPPPRLLLHSYCCKSLTQPGSENTCASLRVLTSAAPRPPPPLQVVQAIFIHLEMIAALATIARVYQRRRERYFLVEHALKQGVR